METIPPQQQEEPAPAQEVNPDAIVNIGDYLNFNSDQVKPAEPDRNEAGDDKVDKEIDKIIESFETAGALKHIVTPKPAVRFVITQPSEKAFLEALIDNIMGQNPSFTYELTQSEGLKVYNLTILHNGERKNSFVIDPRFQCGLGVPRIKVPVTNGISHTFQWIPLGCADLLKAPLFSGVNMVGIQEIPMSAMIPVMAVVRAQRDLWPILSLYDKIDMSNLCIQSGSEYQDFGFNAYQVLKNVEAKTGIKGRFRPVYNNPGDFKLISDRSMNTPDGVEVKPLDIEITFDGSPNLRLRSLVNGKEQLVLFDTIFPYPNEETIGPVYGETMADVIRKTDASEVPKGISEGERMYNQYLGGYGIPQQISPLRVKL